MAKHSQNTKLEGKQFRLVKFFAYASFIVLIIFSFPLSVVISQKAKNMLMKSYENYALLVGENLNHQVFQNFVTPIYKKYGKIVLREKEQHELMDTIVRNTIHGFNVDIVNIYDIGKGVIAYSTDPNLIGHKIVENAGYLKAVTGEHSSGLLSSKDDPWGLGIEFTGVTRKLRTYIPFKGENPLAETTGYIGGVFELIQDMTGQYESIVKFQYLVFGLSIVIMGLIFVALLFIVRKAERIIDTRAKEQRDLEYQLNQAERLAALGEMVAGVSHEIRNPLGIIQSTAELLGGMSDSDESKKKLSGVIVEESRRLDNIVTEFLDFARPPKPNFQECYLEEILNKNLYFLHPELDKRHISLRDDLNGRSLKLKADPQLLYRSFLNIFLNAIQSMENAGEMTVNVEEKKGYYIVCIKDTGKGISEENIGKIFDPFFSSKDKGSGLGLSIVKAIIESHKGSINIESKKDSGTKVIIELPRGI